MSFLKHKEGKMSFSRFSKQEVVKNFHTPEKYGDFLILGFFLVKPEFADKNNSYEIPGLSRLVKKIRSKHETNFDYLTKTKENQIIENQISVKSTGKAESDTIKDLNIEHNAQLLSGDKLDNNFYGDESEINILTQNTVAQNSVGIAELKTNSTKKDVVKESKKSDFLEYLTETLGAQSLLNDEIEPFLTSLNENEKKALLKGIYLGAATSSIRLSERGNQITTSGYHLEFSFSKNILKVLTQKLLENFGISVKETRRKNDFVLYVKDAETVSDILALVGASGCVLSLQSEMVKRELRNKINRQTNCVAANISKTVDASMRQLWAIEKIEKTVGLETLSKELYETALLRMANPEESLLDLLSISDIKISRSGLSHRLKKIVEIAEKLDKN